MEWTPERIKALRKRLGLDQAEFADLLGYGASQRVSELEKGKRGATGPTARLLDYVDAYGVLAERAVRSLA
jgi:transcriptional regulator with XRE-family HTH domain